MNKILFVGAVFVFVSVISCHNAGNNKSGNADNSKVDSIWKQLDEAHVAGMSKMGKLSRFQTQVEHLIDSIGKLTGKAKSESAPYLSSLESLLNELKSAQDGMDKWMAEFKYDSAENNPAIRAQYFASEKTKISGVAEQMQQAIRKADSVLKK
jgi:hypothetical protein